ncbi:complement receptor type 2-like [Parasteatoda tepidariorum]|uniref:complement receptor type 2-like n=1 Tax=Parasteatoda tepidariorum TaxID=114398 RepID=UPI0039BCD1BF
MTNGRIMNRESKVATNSFIGADVPANLVERYFVVVIHWKSGHIAKIVGLMCQPPTLPKDIIIGRTCGIHSDGICEVTCRINGLELWKSYIRCLKNGQWENPPSCVPRTRSPIIELIKCSHLPESIEDLSTCIRIKMAISASTSSSKSLCQTALDLFVKFGNCTEISEDCTVTCGTSTMTLFCLEEGSMYPQCIPPKLLKCPELKFAKLINCSREKDTSCKIQCPDGNFVPQEAICLPSGEWSPLPSCHARFQCASEPLPSDILFINTTCKTSQSISCRVGCQVYEYEPKNESYSKQVVFIKEAYCGPAGHWENLPDCQTAKLHFWNKRIDSSYCSDPEFDRNAILQNGCLTREGSICLLKCKEGYEPNGLFILRCLKKKWISEIRCSVIKKCQSLPGHLKFVCNCRKTAGLFCRVQCLSGIPRGSKTVYCSYSSKWMYLPLCLSKSYNKTSDCLPKFLPPYLKFVDKCTFKSGEICQVKCTARFVLVGLHFIVCRKGQWRNIPRCFPQKHSPFKLLKIQCEFPPSIPGNLKIIGICNRDGGVSCNLMCRDSRAKIIGPNATTCLPPGLWSRVEPCVGGKNYCSEPKLPKHLEFTSKCNGVEIGSKCAIRCKHHKQLQFTLICRNIEGWNRFPNCSCPPPHLKGPILANESCLSKYPGEYCNLKCKIGYILKKNAFIKCLNGLKWTSLPFCSKIMCPKPKLSKSLVFKEDCSSKSSGEYCFLECRENGTFPKANKIKCLDGLHWSILPICACPPPIITEELVFKTNCIHVVPSGNCTLSCKGHALLVGNPLITCRADMTWTNLPRCKKVFCSKPVVPSTVFLSEHCISKSPGEHCSVECGYSGRILGPNKITCLESLRWSSFPKCACPPPMLPDNLSLKENCSDKHPGERCSLACDKKKFAQDIDYIYCQNLTYNWGLFPTCKRKTCTKMKLPKTLSYVGDCSGIIPGKTCQVECKEGGKLHGSRYIKCINGVLWTSMPNCSCPSPDLPDNMEADANCNDIRIGERCRLKCRKPFHLTGKSDIVCQTNTRWTSTPVCKNIMCPVPDLPNYLDFYDDCSSKLIGQKCHLECKEGGTFIGSNTLICLKANNLFSWSPFPSCTCPPPALSNGLKSVENCDYKKRGETCSLACIGNAAIIGINYITCQNNTKWTSLPKCRNLFCFRPNPPKELLFQEDCSNKNIGDSCAFECRHGGKTIPNNTISCLTFKHWSAFPNCSCPSPVFPNNLHLLEDCSLKQPGEICRVTCKEKSLNLYHSSIRCGKDFRWGIFPSCKLKNCPKPVLPNYISLDDDCNSKKPGDVCKVVCKMGGISVGNDFIRCLRDLKWTSFPFCTCPSPKLRQGMLSIENCTFKIPGEKCRIKCHESLKLEGKSFVLCRNDNRWNIESKCHKKFCPKPNLPSHLLFNENCSLKSVKERCELLCKHGGELMKRSFIECYSSLKWSKFPQCTCPLPVLNKNLKFREEVCFNKTAGEKCLLKCKTKQKAPEKIYLRCLQGGTWTNLPKCTVSKKNKINLK